MFKKSILISTMIAASSLALPVMTWVPSYAVPDAQLALENTFGGIKVSDVVTRIGLQYWNLRDTGGVYNQTTDSNAIWFVNYAHPKNIQVLLTLVDYDTSFNWQITRDACFGANQAKTINSILGEVDRLNLDGVDLDLEGEDQNGGPFTTTDQSNYAQFASVLADSLHARSKILTICSYPTDTYGAPKPGWWPSVLGKADGIGSMGYNSVGLAGTSTTSYYGQTNKALGYGFKQDQFMMGFPAWLDTWLNQSSTAQVSWFVDSLARPTGVSMWDLHDFNLGYWADPVIWQKLQKIKNMKNGDTNIVIVNANSANVIDNMNSPGSNLAGGIWFANSDYWSRDSISKLQSTKVWDLNKDYDLALQMGTWGDITNGYTHYGQAPVLAADMETYAPVDTSKTAPWAMGSLNMEFMPRDCSKASACWIVDSTGVEKDLSAYQNIVVGLKCDAGKSMWLSIASLANMYSSLPGDSVQCDGTFRDYNLSLTQASDRTGAVHTNYAKNAFRLNLEWYNNGSADSNHVYIAGVALDQPVVSKLDFTSIKSNPITSPLIFSQGILSLPQGSTYLISDIQGHLILQGQSASGQVNLSNLSAGSYFVKTPTGIRSLIIAQ